MATDNIQKDYWFMYLNESLISFNNDYQKTQPILSEEAGVKKDDGSRFNGNLIRLKKTP